MKAFDTTETRCLELRDNSIVEKSAIDFFGLQRLRDPLALAARLSEQFEKQNRTLFEKIDVRCEPIFDGRSLRLRLRSGNMVGAIPLFSPTNGRPDFGLVVQPRFPWSGIGPMLSAMGWRVTPQPLKLPLLHRSERKVPAWVLSSMILARLKLLLEGLNRRFEWQKEFLRAPRGSVDWNLYARDGLPSGRFLSIPCSFPDLRDDQQLKGMIRFALERQLRSLQTQSHHGSFVHKLIDFCQMLLGRVRGTLSVSPSPSLISGWQKRPLNTLVFLEGIEAIEWTAEERGLAGLSDLEGIPWVLPMEKFFEAWCETVLSLVARRTGALLRTARQKETTRPIAWEPPYFGSQKSLMPDIWLQWESSTLIVDAKYKRHLHEINDKPWSQVDKEVKDQHRSDLLQVLAYGNLATTKDVTTCLLYPCSGSTWHSLKERKQLFHKADLVVGSKTLRLWLTAVPMGSPVEEVAVALEQEIRPLLSS